MASAFLWLARTYGLRKHHQHIWLAQTSPAPYGLRPHTRLPLDRARPNIRPDFGNSIGVRDPTFPHNAFRVAILPNTHYCSMHVHLFGRKMRVKEIEAVNLVSPIRSAGACTARRGGTFEVQVAVGILPPELRRRLLHLRQRPPKAVRIVSTRKDPGPEVTRRIIRCRATATGTVTCHLPCCGLG